MSRLIVGLDPGYEKSSFVLFNGEAVLRTVEAENEQLIPRLVDCAFNLGAILVVEKVECFGLAVGIEVLDTCMWTGRFIQAWLPGRFDRMPRRVVKTHLCHSARATDANIRTALCDRFGGAEKAIGRKKAPGPLHSLKGHLWAAFAVAITWSDLHDHEAREIRRGIQPEF